MKTKIRKTTELVDGVEYEYGSTECRQACKTYDRQSRTYRVLHRSVTLGRDTWEPGDVFPSHPKDMGGSVGYGAACRQLCDAGVIELYVEPVTKVRGSRRKRSGGSQIELPNLNEALSE